MAVTSIARSVGSINQVLENDQPSVVTRIASIVAAVFYLLAKLTWYIVASPFYLCKFVYDKCFASTPVPRDQINQIEIPALPSDNDNGASHAIATARVQAHQAEVASRYQQLTTPVPFAQFPFAQQARRTFPPQPAANYAQDSFIPDSGEPAGPVNSAPARVRIDLARGPQLDGMNLPFTKVALSAPMRDKLALYSNMPSDKINFFKTAIKNLLSELDRKDQEALKTFKEQFECLEGAVANACLVALVRSYIFNPSLEDFGFDYFTHNEFVLGGRCQTRTHNYLPELKQLRSQFYRLSESDKTTLLDAANCLDISAVGSLSEDGKTLFREIVKIANSLQQNNDGFNRAFQVVHKIIFPQEQE